MIELVFIVCLKSSPRLCEERVLSYLAAHSPVACMAQAPPELARWALDHPDYTVKRWKCLTPGRRALDA